MGDLIAELRSSPELAADPHPHFAKMRAAGPVVRGEHDVQLCRRAEVEWALRHHETFSAIDAVDIGNVRPLIPLSVDPPEQRNYRKLLDPLFAPSEVNKREPAIRQLVNDLIDAFVDRGECDFGEEFAVPLPSQVILDLIGMPLSDLPELLMLKEDILRPRGTTPDEQRRNRASRAKNVYAYFDAILDERARRPRSDLLSRFLQAEVDGHRLSREDVLDICYLFLVAGLDTITDTLECGFATLARRPDLRRQIVDDPAVVPSAVEELLRWESVTQMVARKATEDVDVGGCPIRKGEIVHINIGSANTDETEFEDVNTIDLRRNPNRHLGFGGGVHRCLGSHLARTELRVAFREWHRRIPDYWLKEGVELVYTPTVRSVRNVLLEFNAA